MSEILKNLMNIAAQMPPFVGFTMQPSHFHYYEQFTRDEGMFGKGQIIPNYCVPNQPCPIARWSSHKLMMNYIRRKDEESSNSRNNKIFKGDK